MAQSLRYHHTNLRVDVQYISEFIHTERQFCHFGMLVGATEAQFPFKLPVTHGKIISVHSAKLFLIEVESVRYCPEIT